MQNGREGQMLRKRNPGQGEGDRIREVKKGVDGSEDTMPVSFFKVFYSYKRLLLMCAVVCILQFLLGISFFSLFPQQTNQSKSHSEQSMETVPPKVVGLRYPCNITSKDAVSAIKRASSTSCKQEIVDLVCDLEKQMVYPASLPRSCKPQVDKESKVSNLGCFKDNFSKRILQGHMVKLKYSNSPQACLAACMDAGFSFSGTQYGVECFCGNSSPDKELLLDASKCSMICPGKKDSTCGGYLAMQVQSTGVKPFVPPKLAEGEVEGSQPVRVVYLLTVAGRAYRQVTRLIKRLYSSHHYILVHVDARQEYLYRELVKLSHTLPNLRLVKQRFSTIWGGSSLLSMLLSSMGELLSMSDWSDWDFVLNLSESDWPVKSQEQLVQFLSANRGKNFAKGHGREQDKFIKKQGLDRTFHECDTHMWRIGPRTLPLGIQIDGGSDWICLNRKFVEYTVNSGDELVVGLKALFKYTLLPAESFFHSLLRNSEFCGTYVDNNLHLTNWKRKQGCKCQYKAIVDWCGCSPNDFITEDWERIESTQPKQIFFARKFEPVIHQGVLNRVDAWVHEPGEDDEEAEVVSLNSYWQNIYHHEDLESIDISVIKLFVESRLDSVLGSCQSDLAVDIILEINALFQENEYKGSLVLVRLKSPKSSVAVTLEIMIKCKQNLQMTHEGEELSSRIEEFSIGSDFDLKELVFRNFLNLLTSQHKPVARIKIKEGKSSAKLQLAWISPTGSLAHISRLQINETTSTSVESLALDLTLPITPGVWRVVVIYDGVLHSEEEFLVVPNPLKFGPIKDLQNPGLLDSKIEKLLDKSRSLEKIEDTEDLEAALNKYFELLDSCGSLTCLKDCRITSWSSKFPDPKSQISGIDSVTREIY